MLQNRTHHPKRDKEDMRRTMLKCFPNSKHTRDTTCRERICYNTERTTPKGTKKTWEEHCWIASSSLQKQHLLFLYHLHLDRLDLIWNNPSIDTSDKYLHLNLGFQFPAWYYQMKPSKNKNKFHRVQRREWCRATIARHLAISPYSPSTTRPSRPTAFCKDGKSREQHKAGNQVIDFNRE